MSETKAKYKVTNWPEYNDALITRGAVTLWMNESILAEWKAGARSGKRGRPRFYSDTAMECMLALKCVYKLPLRGAEGLLRSLFDLLGVETAVPSYATLCRRQGRLKPDLGAVGTGEPIHLVVDSTGLKAFGEGEWKTRKHGFGRRRGWKKLHLAVDAVNREIVATELTDNNVHDCEVFGRLLVSVEGEIERVGGDGAYDKWECRYRIAERGAGAVVPPRADAAVSGGETRAEQERDAAVEQIRENGAEHWREHSGYHQRSLAETAVFQIKTAFGPEIRANEIQNQIAEAVMKSKVLNKFIHQGMPDSVKIEE